MKGVTYAAGVALATALIGPLAAVAVVVFASVRPDGSARELLALPLALLLSLLIGAAVSVIPNALGATAMARLGVRERRARHPLAWLVAGVATGLLIWSAIDGRSGVGAAFLAVSGGTCALLCRRGTAWFD